MIHLFIDNAQKSNYKTLVSLSDMHQDPYGIERIFNARLVRGAILLGYDTGSEEIKRLAAKGYPLVLVNQERDSVHKNIVEN